MKPSFVRLLGATALATSVAAPVHAQTVSAESQGESEVHVLDELRVLDTAEEQARQALGSSVITAEDIEKRPPVNDLSDIIRREPGVNLTNAGASGVFGNNRQIDIRGMGPENTLILIDGKPVQSRNSVFMGRNGERNTRGDTNWVPAEEVERIEILRGPAAARYGSGSAGGVVNIITKGPATQFHASLTGYVQQPEDTRESNTKRLNATLSGPVANGVSFRIYGNYNRTGADDPDINEVAAAVAAGNIPPGGREGVENRDVNAMLRFTPAQGQRIDIEAGYSRQGNEYSGEYQMGTGATSANIAALIGEETNIRRRATTSLNYQGDFAFGTARLVAQYEFTRDRRLNEVQSGGGYGNINTLTDFSESRTRNWYANGSLNVPFEFAGMTHVATVGGEFRHEYLNDPRNVANELVIMNPMIDLSGFLNGDPTSSTDTYAAFVEDNIIVGPVTVTPGARFDSHSQFGDNWSPSLSVAYTPVPDVTIKGGIARAFKAPNLYQANPNYLFTTMGNGCPAAYPNLSQCRILGNPDLEAEISVNKEIGIAYAPKGWNVSVTYFRNDYRNKITVSDEWLGTALFSGTLVNIFQWDNAPRAVVEGVEGNVRVPLARGVSLNTNATYMIQNENKATGAKLSVIPDYTVNSTLDWQVTSQISLLATFTRYGRQVPNGVLWGGATPSGAQLRPREPYNLVGLNANARINPNMRFGLGVSNIFDKRLFRESQSNARGANNYNEPGRAFFVTSTIGF